MADIACPYCGSYGAHTDDCDRLRRIFEASACTEFLDVRVEAGLTTKKAAAT